MGTAAKSATTIPHPICLFIIKKTPAAISSAAMTNFMYLFIVKF